MTWQGQVPCETHVSMTAYAIMRCICDYAHTSPGTPPFIHLSYTCRTRVVPATNVNRCGHGFMPAVCACRAFERKQKLARERGTPMDPVKAAQERAYQESTIGGRGGRGYGNASFTAGSSGARHQGAAAAAAAAGRANTARAVTMATTTLPPVEGLPVPDGTTPLNTPRRIADLGLTASQGVYLMQAPSALSMGVGSENVSIINNNTGTTSTGAAASPGQGGSGSGSQSRGGSFTGVNMGPSAPSSGAGGIGGLGSSAGPPVGLPPLPELSGLSVSSAADKAAGHPNQDAAAAAAAAEGQTGAVQQQGHPDLPDGIPLTHRGMDPAGSKGEPALPPELVRVGRSDKVRHVFTGTYARPERLEEVLKAQSQAAIEKNPAGEAERALGRVLVHVWVGSGRKVCVGVWVWVCGCRGVWVWRV